MQCLHKWKAEQDKVYGTYRDVCEFCGCEGMLASAPDERGYYQIVAKPLATIIDLELFKNSRKAKIHDKKIIGN